jgi:hypothetical protein
VTSGAQGAAGRTTLFCDFLKNLSSRGGFDEVFDAGHFVVGETVEDDVSP